MIFSSKEIYHSVIFQILMAMMLIAAMALMSMSMAVYVTLDTQDDAEAINLAGSLRMQSYRIANILSLAGEGEVIDPRQDLSTERQKFSDKLYRSSIAQLIEQSGNTPLTKSYLKVIENWQNHMEPLLDQAALDVPNIVWPDVNQQYNQNLETYVDDIDLMVMHLQRNTEGKIELLGMTEGVSIFLIIFIMIFFVMKADTNFIVPLRSLVRAAEKVEKGDLAHRTTYTGDNELGLLSQTFNSMTASLEAQYRNLEDQVAERTDKLRKYNLALNFLYKTSREITSNPYDQQLLRIFISDLKKVIEVRVINLRIKAEVGYSDYEIISTGKNSEDTAPTEGDFSLLLRNRDEEYGSIFVSTRAGTELEPWQSQLLKTVAETLSTAFAFHRTLDRERRVILYEERSTIARELHDSLAQSLSYMKMEVARLKKMIERGFEPDQVEGAISDLQEGLNAAYKHLRELLVTFRVKLDAPDLRTALEHAVNEFNERSNALVTLDYALGSYTMSPNEDIHVLYIVREALTNAIKHSQASNICLRCIRSEDGGAIFLVDDDGIGMPETPEKQHHYGIYTMRERALQLDGEFTCSRRSSGGTRIQLKMNLATDGLHA